MPRRITPKSAGLKALRSLEEASKIGEGRMGFSFSTGDWEIGKKLHHLWDHPRKDQYQDANSISDLSRDSRRLEYIIRLCKALKKSASELLVVQERAFRPNAVKLGKCIAALPDELLGLIFKFATHDEQEGTRHAYWLSQVSGRFRRIAIADKSLWKTQFQCYDYLDHSSINRTISRCSPDSDLHIVVNFDDFSSSDIITTKSFVQHCSEHAPRWKTLTVRGSWQFGETLDTINMNETLEEIMEKELELPRLQELCLIERRMDRTGQYMCYFDDDEFTDQVLWSTPNLRVLRSTQYIPPPSFPFETLTEFTLSLKFVGGSAADALTRLHEFLHTRSNLLSLDLHLRDLDDSAGNEIELSTAAPLLSLKKFRLSITNLETLQTIVEDFIIALGMHNLENYTLSTNSFDLPLNLLLNPIVHPRITALTVEVPRRTSPPSYNENTSAVVIPLDELPNVSSLCVTAHNKILISRERAPDQSEFEGSCLRELRLRSCSFAGISGRKGLREMVSSLKNADVWDGLEIVTVQTCAPLEYEDAVEVIGRERLLFLRS